MVPQIELSSIEDRISVGISITITAPYRDLPDAALLASLCVGCWLVPDGVYVEHFEVLDGDAVAVETEAFAVAVGKMAAHGVGEEAAVNEYFHRCAVNVDVGCQLHAGGILGGVVVAVECGAVEVIVHEALSGKANGCVCGV